MTDTPEVIYDEAHVPDYELPDLLTDLSGAKIETAEQWPARRAEILELYKRHIFGRVPEMAVSVEHALI